VMGVPLMAVGLTKPYRILIRRSGDGLFLNSEDGWAQDAESAQVFEHATNAVIFATGQDLRGAEIIMTDGDRSIVLLRL
jgi:hypothetical protein